MADQRRLIGVIGLVLLIAAGIGVWMLYTGDAGGTALTVNGTIHKTFNQVVTVRARATGSPSVSL